MRPKVVTVHSVIAEKGANRVSVSADAEGHGVTRGDPTITSVTFWVIASEAPRIGDKYVVQVIREDAQ